MENIIIIDTDIIINYVKQSTSTILESYIRLQNQKKVELKVSTITIFEYFSGVSFSNNMEYETAELLFNQFTIQEVNEKIVKIAARLNNERKLSSSIGLADVLIASTALYLGAPLLTLNKHHFKLLPNLVFA